MKRLCILVIVLVTCIAAAAHPGTPKKTSGHGLPGTPHGGGIFERQRLNDGNVKVREKTGCPNFSAPSAQP